MRECGNWKFHIPSGAGRILDTLHAAGFEAYIVGGCVRDCILGRTPTDWDITTSASPQKMKQLFRKTVDTGIQHGTVTVLMPDGQYEVTTYRVDGEYLDGRHPEEVTFTASLTEDLKRRDFTINAMAYSEETGVIDEFDGIGDIRRKMIRAVGNADRRFSEDALRIMRALRFSAQLDYSIEEKTKEAITRFAPRLSLVSAERIRTELEKTICSDHPERLRDAYMLGLTKYFLPEFDVCMSCAQNNPHHRYTVGEHILHAMQAVRADKVLRLTMLLHDIGKPSCKTTDAEGIDHFHGHVNKSAEMAGRILKRLRYDNATIDTVVRLVSCHDMYMENTESAVRFGMVRVGPELFLPLMEVKLADGAAQSSYRIGMKRRQVDTWIRLYREIIRRGDCLDLKHLAVTGKDLMAAGVPRGPEIGTVLKRMLQDVLQEPSHNEKTYLMNRYVLRENL